MNWLDGIEADFQALRDEGLLDEDDDSVRMVRVIRELEYAAKRALMNIHPVYTDESLGIAVKVLTNAIKLLEADDAKELLNVAG